MEKFFYKEIKNIKGITRVDLAKPSQVAAEAFTKDLQVRPQN